MPAIAGGATPVGPVPEKPPRDRVFAAVPPAPTFPPPSSRAAGIPPAGRAAPDDRDPEPPQRPEPPRGDTKSNTKSNRRTTSRRRKATMPPPGTVSALPPVQPNAVPGIEDPSRYEEITPMG